MSTKGLQIHPDWIEEIRSTYKCRYLTQEKLAEEADITSLDAVNKFLNGKTISREYFWKLCTLLEFDKVQVIKPRSSIAPHIVVKPKTEDSNFEIVVETSQLELEDPNFIGRDNEIGFIHNLTALGNKCILILSSGGVGKTTLAKNYLNQVFGSYIELNIAKEKQNIVSVVIWVEETLRNLKEEPGREFSISLARLKSKLQQERIGVLIDNLEPALDRNGQFLPEHRDYFELLRVLSDRSLRSTTLITSREPLNENLDIQNLILGGLKLNVWQQFFKERGIDTNTPILAEVHKAFDGNALAMKVLCEPIRESYEGNIEAYWKDHKTEGGLMVEMAVENLIREQFDRLRDTCPEAYKLLCRMGCFRYQDVPTIPKEGLFSLLWDVPQEQHVRAVYSIKSRFLIEFDKGEYFLHPVIRAEVISRLRASGEWEETNHKAAEFWENTIINEDLFKNRLSIFEAFHHYYTVEDYERAFSVFDKKANKNIYVRNRYAYLRFWGYSSNIADCLEKLKDNVNGIIKTSILGSIGTCHYYSGNYHLAIRFLELVKNMIESESNYRHQRLYPICLNYLARPYHFIGESKQAIKYCKKALESIGKIDPLEEVVIGAEDEYQYEVTESNIFQSLAYIYCELGAYDEGLSYAEKAFSCSKPSTRINPLYREVGDSLAIKAFALYGQEKAEEAIDVMEESIRNFQVITDYLSEGYARCYLIKFYLEVDLQKAENQILEVQKIYNNGCKSIIMNANLRERPDFAKWLPREHSIQICTAMT